MEKITFNQNWNNKLGCKAFTTIRLANPNRYRTGEQYEIFFKNEKIGVATLKSCSYFFLEKLTNHMAYLDTGYSADDTRAMLKIIYKNKNIDFEKQQMCYLLLIMNKKQKK